MNLSPLLLRCLGALLLITLCGCEQASPVQYRIVMIPKGMTHEFWQSIHRGGQRAARDLAEDGIAIQVLFDGPLRERDALEQIQIMDRRVATGVHGIILAPQHSVIMSAAVKRAQEEGIPVVIIDSGLADRERIIRYVATDNYNGGWLAGEHLAKTLRDEGKKEPFKVVLLRYQVGSESTEQREQGFLDYFDSANHNRPRKDGPPPAVDWLSTSKYAGATRDSASREAAPLIQQYGQQMDAIFAPNESSASGVLDVLRSQNLNMGSKDATRKVHLMGFDSSKPLLQAVQEGDVDGLILQDPYWMGYLSVWTLVRHLEGDDVNESRRKLDISTGEYVITRANVGSPQTLALFQKDAQETRDLRSRVRGGTTEK